MPVSFPRSQNSLLNSGLVDRLGNNEADAVDLTETTKAIFKVAGEFIDDCATNLIKADRVSSGDLTDSMKPVIVESGVNNIIDIYVNDYYKFVDKGVRGWQDKKGSGSPYSFKKPTGAKKGNSKMVAAVRKWVVRESISFRNTKQPINSRENRRSKITDTSTRTAIVISGKIRKDGLKKTGFFSTAVRTLEDKLGRGVADALRIDVIESLGSF